MSQAQAALNRATQYLQNTASTIEPKTEFDAGMKAGLTRATLLTGYRVNAVLVGSSAYRTLNATLDHFLKTAEQNTPDPENSSFLAGVRRGAVLTLENVAHAANAEACYLAALDDLTATIRSTEKDAEYKRGLELIFHLVSVNAEEYNHAQLTARGTCPNAVDISTLPMPESQRQTINVLTSLLQKAHKGEILEVCAISTLADGETYFAAFSPCSNRFSLAGYMMSVAQNRLQMGPIQTAK